MSEHRLRWVLSPITRWRRFKRFVLRGCYHALPRALGITFTLHGVVQTVARLGLVAAITLTPYWSDWLVRGEVSPQKAGWASVIILALLIAKHLLDTFGTTRADASRQRRLLQQCATRQTVINRDLFKAMPPRISIDQAERVRLSEKILECMHHVVKLHTKSDEGDFQTNPNRKSLPRSQSLPESKITSSANGSASEARPRAFDTHGAAGARYRPGKEKPPSSGGFLSYR